MHISPIKVLLVDDDEDDYILTRSFFLEIKGQPFQLDWVDDYEAALVQMGQNQHDIYLLDYRLGSKNGLDLLQAAIQQGCEAPIILLTGQGDRAIDMAAMKAGAADYLVKSEINAPILERTIRYAIEQTQTLVQLRRALQENNQLALAITNISTGVIITDPKQGNSVTFVNRAFTEITGYTATEVMGKNCRLLQGIDTDPEVVKQIRAAIAQVKPITCTLLNYRKDGTPFWNQLTINPVFDPQGELIHFIGLQMDVTERKQGEEALRESEERYALAVQGANDGIWDWNLKTDHVFFSLRWKTMLGYQDHEISNTLNEWLDRIHPEDLHWVKRQLTEHLNGLTPHFESEYRIQHRDGIYRWMLSRGLAVQDEGRITRMAGSQTDVTAWKQAEEKLVHDALHDTLTGLPNRVLLMERLRHAMQLFQRSNNLFAVMFIDLDRFKVINDSLGHMLGDQLLIAIADRLAHCLRPSDTVARLGGDEFVILLEEVKDRTSVALIANRVQQELSLPFNLEGHDVFTAASIGIAFGSSQYSRPEELLRDADTAMYQAKEKGRARFEIFTAKMHTHAVALLQLETDLRRAIDRQELLLYYQPIISLRDRQIVGFESLLRWNHVTQGLISPSKFIPIAEDTGMIVPIGHWVMQEACRQMRQWQQQFPNLPPLTVNVNLSGKQFTPELAVEVKRVLQETGLHAQHLKLEITESLLMENADRATVTLAELRELGVHLAIDDFGTGYSSLSYLHRFPIDTLKIDRSFISKIDRDPEQLMIVRTIIMLAWNIGMEVVAEGVETAKQLAQLRALQCEYAQGYFFYKPLDVDSTTHLIRKKLLNKKLEPI